MSTLAPIRAAMQTDRGLVRDHNEDFVDKWEPATREAEAQSGWLYIVADGVGGAEAGEVASQYATQQAKHHYLNNNGEANLGQRLLQALHAANTDLRQLVAERDMNKRMATTMVATVIHGQRAFIANVGDSRGYHWRDNELRQITKDQSLVAKLLEEGAITADEAANHPHKNVILYSIGSERTPQIDLFEFLVQPGDKIVLCSDGLTRHLSDAEISQIVAQSDLDAAATQLIKLANERGGQDNISAAIVEYGVQETAVQQTAAQPATQVIQRSKPLPRRATKAFMIPYTLFLSLVETVLIVLVWLLLRV